MSIPSTTIPWTLGLEVEIKMIVKLMKIMIVISLFGVWAGVRRWWISCFEQVI